MKKSLLAIVVGALAVASTANAGLYAEGDLGLSRTKLSNGGSSKTKVEPRVAVGYKLGNMRVAGDYTHPVSYTHLTLPTILRVKIQVVAVG